MKLMILAIGLTMATIANAQSRFPAITPRSPAGLKPVLEQLSEMHGQYVVEGRMRDGTACTVRVSTTPTEFKISVFDNRPHQALEEWIITPRTRMLSFELRDNPDQRTLLSMRDRIVYPPGSGARDVDLTLYIEVADDGRKVFVRYEDRIKRRNYVCHGYKSKP